MPPGWVGAFLLLGGCTADPTKATARTWEPRRGFCGVFEAQGDEQAPRQAPTHRGRCLFCCSFSCQRGRAELGPRPSGQARLQHAALYGLGHAAGCCLPQSTTRTTTSEGNPREGGSRPWKQRQCLQSGGRSLCTDLGSRGNPWHKPTTSAHTSIGNAAQGLLLAEELGNIP